MIPMKTLTMGGKKYEIVDEQARNQINTEREDIRKSCATAIVKTVEGPSIAVRDSSDNQLLGMRLFGKTTQVSTTGVQLFDKSTAVSGMLETDGTVITDGAYVTSDFIPVTPSTAYFQTEKNSIRGKFYDVDKNPLTTEWDMQLATAGTFTTPADAHYFRTTIGAALVDGYMLNVGSAGLPYEPYSGGVASPDPNYPQKLESIENPVVNIRGGNLLPFTYADGMSKTMNGITFEVQPDGGVLVNGTATDRAHFSFNYTSNKNALPNGWLSTSSGIGYGTGIPQIQNDIYVDDKYVTSVQTLTELGSRGEFFGKVELGASRVKVDAGVTVVSQLVYPRLCAFENVLEYEKPKMAQTIALARTFPGIPATYGYNYIDMDGQQWIGDEIDFERGVYVQRIMTYAPTSMVSVAPDTKNNRAHVTLPYPGLPFSYGEASGICSHFKYNANVYSDTGNELGFIISNETMFFRFTSESSINTTELGNAWLEEQAAAGTPFTVMYILANPIETPLPDEELAAYKQLYTNYPNTTVFNNIGSHMKISYNTDTRLFIENYCKSLLEGASS